MTQLSHKFVKNIPEELEEGVIYISIEYALVIHSCCCGCKNQVVTPLSPSDWKLLFDGKTISLYPSIGNWNFKCRSHYWIKNDKVMWAPKWTKKDIVEDMELSEPINGIDNKTKKRKSLINWWLRRDSNK